MGENLVFYCLKPETIFLCANPSEISLALPRPRLPRPLGGTKGLGASLQTDSWWLQKEKRWKLKSVLSSADEFTPHRKKLSPHTVQHVSCIPLLEPCLVLAGQHQPYLNQVNWQISLETSFFYMSQPVFPVRLHVESLKILEQEIISTKLVSDEKPVQW